MNSRAAAKQRFLEASGWGGAERRFLAGDASDRSYERLSQNDSCAVLMDAPPGQGDDPAEFLTIATHLRRLGLSAPACLAQDLSHGFLLLEDFGDNVFARIILADPTLQKRLYTAASDVLTHLQHNPAPDGRGNLSAMDWADAACLALDWYRFAITGDRVATDDFRATLADALYHYADGQRVLILRDYHAENLIWLPDRAGLAQVGLLDFQLAQMGQPAYDLVSLLQDARRDVSPETELAVRRHFQTSRGETEADFFPAYTVLGAQRALRILGIFARLCLHGGKPGYVSLIPRVWGQLQRNLAAPELANLSKICAKLLPAPDPEALSKIGAQCGRFR